MCLSTVYLDLGDRQELVMKEVARMEKDGEGFLLFDLFGGNKFIRGRIKKVDFVDDHSVVLEGRKRNRKVGRIPH